MPVSSKQLTVQELQQQVEKTRGEAGDLPCFFEWEGQLIPVFDDDFSVREVTYKGRKFLAFILDADS